MTWSPENMTGIDAASSPFHRENLALPVKQKQYQLKFTGMLNFSSTSNSFSKSQISLDERKLLKLHFVKKNLLHVSIKFEIQTGNQY